MKGCSEQPCDYDGKRLNDMGDGRKLCSKHFAKAVDEMAGVAPKCPHGLATPEGCDVCSERGIWAGISEAEARGDLDPAKVGAAMEAEFEDGIGDHTPIPPREENYVRPTQEQLQKALDTIRADTGLNHGAIIVRCWALAMIDYRGPVGEQAWGLMAERVSRSAVDGIAFITGLAAASNAGSTERYVELIPELAAVRRSKTR